MTVAFEKAADRNHQSRLRIAEIAALNGSQDLRTQRDGMAAALQKILEHAVAYDDRHVAAIARAALAKAGA